MFSRTVVLSRIACLRYFKNIKSIRFVSDHEVTTNFYCLTSFFAPKKWVPYGKGIVTQVFSSAIKVF